MSNLRNAYVTLSISGVKGHMCHLCQIEMINFIVHVPKDILYRVISIQVHVCIMYVNVFPK